MGEAKKKRRTVLISTPTLNIRSGPGFEHESVGFVEVGKHDIEDIKNGFGKMSDGSGWIFMAFADPVVEKKKKEENDESETKTEE